MSSTYLALPVCIVYSLDACESSRVPAELVVACRWVDDIGAVVGPDEVAGALGVLLSSDCGGAEAGDDDERLHCVILLDWMVAVGGAGSQIKNELSAEPKAAR